MKKLCLFLLPLFILSPISATAQSLPIGDPFEIYQRSIAIPDSIYTHPSYNLRSVESFNPQISNPSSIQAHPWQNHHFFQPADERRFTIHAPTLITTTNSDFPAGQNDGAMWQGKGINTSFSVGANLRYGPLNISVRPEFGYTQNNDFELSPLRTGNRISEFGMPKPSGTMDSPQRFGSDSYSWLHPGQSFARLQYKGFAGGISTENFWVGPAQHNPLMFSNNAPGFLHGFLGSYRPIETPIGNLEGRLFWGGAQESDYFDGNPDNNLRLISGIVLNYSPSFAKGLHLGLTRNFMEYIPDDGIQSEQIFRPFQAYSDENFAAGGENTNNQMISVFGRWGFPDSGFEMYFEFGRNDNFRETRDLLVHPDHARAYMLGMMQRVDLPGNRFLSVNYEMTHLQVPRTVIGRTNGPTYQHSVIRQGWTNQGQVLGAGINSGSNNQILSTRMYDSWGMAGLSFNRIEHFNDRLRRNFSRIRSYQTAEDVTFTQDNLREIEFRLGLHGLIFLPHNLELQASAYQSFFRNRNNLYENNERNLNIQLTLRYQLPGFAR